MCTCNSAPRGRVRCSFVMLANLHADFRLCSVVLVPVNWTCWVTDVSSCYLFSKLAGNQLHSISHYFANDLASYASYAYYFLILLKRAHRWTYLSTTSTAASVFAISALRHPSPFPRQPAQMCTSAADAPSRTNPNPEKPCHRPGGQG